MTTETLYAVILLLFSSSGARAAFTALNSVFAAWGSRKQSERCGSELAELALCCLMSYSGAVVVVGVVGGTLCWCPPEVILPTAPKLLACNYVTQISRLVAAPCSQPRLLLCRQAVLSQEWWSSFTTCCGQTTGCPETLHSSSA